LLEVCVIKFKFAVISFFFARLYNDLQKQQERVIRKKIYYYYYYYF
jgi:hypothetical protein